ncbi:myb family transcription factor family protein [Hibiscus syriacus]|uniref:Myb family transcription factor family protein n=2 Tax=Hibiscus syriacus TaxID=106335 RepID=A0A6A2ZE88_HIBSY|nr:myb family transcription factor family protein [Hibiscus syriacus]
MKIKALIQTLIYTQACRLIRAFSKAKSIVIHIYKQNIPIQFLISNSSKKKYKHKKFFFGSFRLHINWCSSHVTPVPAPVLQGCCNSTSNFGQEETVESELSGYLQWLEENKVNEEPKGETDINEIDELAEMFIANCHEKFMLEKQESYRRFQEMMARSM